jgi:hypothetical protein
MWKEPKIDQGLKKVPLANWPMVDINKQMLCYLPLLGS